MLLRPSGVQVDLETAARATKWTAVARMGSRVVVAGNDDSRTGVLAVVGSKGVVRGRVDVGLLNSDYSSGRLA